MAQWSERVKSHEVWPLLHDLGPLIDKALSLDGTESETLDGIARLKSIQSFVGKRLAGADPYILQIGLLDILKNALNAVTVDVQDFIGNNNAAHITDANIHGDVVLTNLATINIPQTTEDFMAAKEAAESYRVGLEKGLSVVTKASSQLLSEIELLRTKLSTLAIDLTAERARVSTTIGEFQAQFSTVQESRSGTFANDQKDRQEKYAALFNEFTQKLG